MEVPRHVPATDGAQGVGQEGPARPGELPVAHEAGLLAYADEGPYGVEEVEEEEDEDHRNEAAPQGP